MITIFGGLNAELAPARAAMVSPGGGLQAIPRDALVSGVRRRFCRWPRMAVDVAESLRPSGPARSMWCMKRCRRVVTPPARCPARYDSLCGSLRASRRARPL